MEGMGAMALMISQLFSGRSVSPVAEQILRRSRKEKQEKDPQGKLLLVLQDGQGVELL